MAVTQTNPGPSQNVGRLLQSGGKDATSLEGRRMARRQRIVTFVVALSVFSCLFFVVLYSVLDARRYWIAILVNLAVGASFAATLLMRRVGPLAEVLWFAATVILGMSAFGYLLGKASGSHLILLSAPAIAMTLLSPRNWAWGWPILVAAWGVFVVANRVLPEFPSLIPMTADEAQSIFLATSAITVGTSFLMVRRALGTAYRAEVAMDDAYRGSEALLTNVMPVSVVERLKRGETIADSFDEVTVMFADIVGFSALARDRQPAEMAAALNRLFSEADRLAVEFGCEKIKTIGDGLLVAAGLPEPRDDHVAACLGYAQALRDAAGRIEIAGAAIVLRIGLQSGPVLAGVLGTDRFAYDIWGDTVNRAARLQTAAAPGEILISDSTRNRLAESIALRSVEGVEMKNIGVARAWAMGPDDRIG